MADPKDVQIVEDIIAREGGYSNDPADAGGQTLYGASKQYSPELWKNGPPTKEAVEADFVQKYIIDPGFDQISDYKLRAQLADFAVNSGAETAIEKLQDVLGVEQDGKLGPQTLAALAQLHPEDVSTGLAIHRVLFLCKVVQRNPSQLKFLTGWAKRALSFIS